VTSVSQGKLTARERIGELLDNGSFVELDELARHQCVDFGMAARRPAGDGVVTGHGLVDGRPVCVYSQDFSVLGGSLGATSGAKILKVLDLATKVGCPIVGINDSAGARIQEGVDALAHYASIARRTVHASGVVPQISLVLGPCAGGAAYVPALTDLVVMAAATSYMFVTGPEVVEAVTGVRTGFAELGGPSVNAEVSGNAHHVAPDEADALSWVRHVLGFLPGNNMTPAPSYAADFPRQVTETDLELDGLVPDSLSVGYDVRDVIVRLVDDGDFVELHAAFARNIVCGLGRVDGASVGVVANQPMILAGAIDVDASEKAARFVRFCDTFGIPVLTLVDVPGYLPGVEQERGGIVRHGAKLLYAYGEATVPMVTVILRKAYGGGYAVMGSKHFGADVNLAWPTAEISVMGAVGAVKVLHRKELARLDGEDRELRRKQLTDEFRRGFSTPYVAADRGYVDAVIAPSQTRLRVASALRALRDKRAAGPARRHGNIPL
jgi:propionyl-CoA carboxylase beta subunit